MANGSVNKTYKFSFEFNKKEIKNSLQEISVDVKDLISEIGTASDKVGVFKEMTDYIQRMDKAIKTFKQNNKGALSQVFDNIDKDSLKYVERLFGVDGSKLIVFDELRTQVNDLATSGAKLSKVKTVAENINKLLSSVGMSNKMINMDMFKQGSSNPAARLEAMNKALGDFTLGYLAFSKNLEANMGGGGGSGIGDNLAKINTEIQKQIDEMHDKITDLEKEKIRYQEILDVFGKSKTTMSIALPKGTDDQIQYMIALKEEFKAAGLEKQRFEAQGLTGKPEYVKSVARYIEAATKVRTAYEHASLTPDAASWALNKGSYTLAEADTAYNSFFVEKNKTTVDRVKKMFKGMVSDINRDMETLNLDIYLKQFEQNTGVKDTIGSYEQLIATLKEYQRLLSMTDEIDQDGVSVQAKLSSLSELIFDTDKLGENFDVIDGLLAELDPSNLDATASKLKEILQLKEKIADTTSKSSNIATEDVRAESDEKVGDIKRETQHSVNEIKSSIIEMFRVLSQAATREYNALMSGANVYTKPGDSDGVTQKTNAAAYLSGLEQDIDIDAHSHKGLSAFINAPDLEQAISRRYSGLTKMSAIVGDEYITTLDLTKVKAEDAYAALAKLQDMTKNSRSKSVSPQQINEIFAGINSQYTNIAQSWDPSQFGDLAQKIFDVRQSADQSLTPLERFKNLLMAVTDGKIDLSKYEEMFKTFSMDNARKMFNDIMAKEGIKEGGKVLKVGDTSTNYLSNVVDDIQRQKDEFIELRKIATLTYSDIRREAEKYLETGDQTFFNKYYHPQEMVKIYDASTEALDGNMSVDDYVAGVARDFGIRPDSASQRELEIMQQISEIDRQIGLTYDYQVDQFDDLIKRRTEILNSAELENSLSEESLQKQRAITQELAARSKYIHDGYDSAYSDFYKEFGTMSDADLSNASLDEIDGYISRLSELYSTLKEADNNYLLGDFDKIDERYNTVMSLLHGAREKFSSGQANAEMYKDLERQAAERELLNLQKAQAAAAEVTAEEQKQEALAEEQIANQDEINAKKQEELNLTRQIAAESKLIEGADGQFALYDNAGAAKLAEDANGQLALYDDARPVVTTPATAIDGQISMDEHLAETRQQLELERQITLEDQKQDAISEGTGDESVADAQQQLNIEREITAEKREQANIAESKAVDPRTGSVQIGTNGVADEVFQSLQKEFQQNMMRVAVHGNQQLENKTKLVLNNNDPDEMFFTLINSFRESMAKVQEAGDVLSGGLGWDAIKTPDGLHKSSVYDFVKGAPIYREAQLAVPTLLEFIKQVGPDVRRRALDFIETDTTKKMQIPSMSDNEVLEQLSNRMYDPLRFGKSIVDYGSFVMPNGMSTGFENAYQFLIGGKKQQDVTTLKQELPELLGNYFNFERTRTDYMQTNPYESELSNLFDGYSSGKHFDVVTQLLGVEFDKRKGTTQDRNYVDAVDKVLQTVFPGSDDFNTGMRKDIMDRVLSMYKSSNPKRMQNYFDENWESSLSQDDKQLLASGRGFIDKNGHISTQNTFGTTGILKTSNTEEIQEAVVQQNALADATERATAAQQEQAAATQQTVAQEEMLVEAAKEEAAVQAQNVVETIVEPEVVQEAQDSVQELTEVPVEAPAAFEEIKNDAESAEVAVEELSDSVKELTQTPEQAPEVLDRIETEAEEAVVSVKQLDDAIEELQADAAPSLEVAPEQPVVTPESSEVVAQEQVEAPAADVAENIEKAAEAEKELVNAATKAAEELSEQAVEAQKVAEETKEAASAEQVMDDGVPDKPTDVGALDEIAQSANEATSSVEKLDAAIDEAVQSEKQLGAETAAQEPISDELKNKIKTQSNAFDNYKNSIKEVCGVSDELKMQLRDLGTTLQTVTNDSELEDWKNQFKRIQNEISIANNVWKSQKRNAVSHIRGSVNSELTIKKLGFDVDGQNLSSEQQAIVNLRDKIINQLTEYEIRVKKGQDADLTAVNTTVKALKEEIEVYKQRNSVVSDSEQKQTKKRTSTVVPKASIVRNATTRHIGLENKIAENKELQASPVVTQQLNQYNAAFNKLVELQGKYKAGQILTDKEEQEFNDAKVACAGYARELENTLKMYERSKTNADHVTFDEFMDDKFVDDNKGKEKALREFIEATYGADAANIKFTDSWNKVTYTVNNGDGTFTKMTSTINGTRTAIDTLAGETQKATGALGKFWNELKGKTKSIGTYLTAYLGWQEVIQVFRKGITYVREIDTALTELKKVTNATNAEYDEFLQNMSKTAGVVGSTVKDLTTMASEWARLGYSMEDSAKLAESTAILLNVSEFKDATAASEALISTMQAFQYTADESQHVVDILNEVGNNYAVSSDGIATALQDSASALMEGGNNLEQATALVAAANRVVQDPNSVGSALRTISLRLRGTSVEV